MTRFAYNKVELANALGISRTGLQRFFALPNHPKPRSDGRHVIETWRRFIAANATRIATGTPTLPLGAKDKARIALVEIQTQREAVRLNRERKELIGEALDVVNEFAARLQTRLDRLARTELPPLLDGRPAREIANVILSKLRNAWNEAGLHVEAFKDTNGKLRVRDISNIVSFDQRKAATG